jgi:hypothetical protein
MGAAPVPNGNPDVAFVPRRILSMPASAAESAAVCPHLPIGVHLPAIDSHPDGGDQENAHACNHHQGRLPVLRARTETMAFQ